MRFRFKIQPSKVGKITARHPYAKGEQKANTPIIIAGQVNPHLLHSDPVNLLLTINFLHENKTRIYVLEHKENI